MTSLQDSAPAPISRKEQILIAAERVFSQTGYDGATMRAIADAAGLQLSLIVYHFEKKLNLYQAVFLRRQYVNENRRALLRAVDLHRSDALARVVDAFADPVLDLHNDPADVCFARLVLREVADPSSQGRPIVRELFDPMAKEFIDALERLNPGRSPEFYQWAYLFAVGILTSSAQDGRVSDLGGPTAVEEGRNSPKGRFIKQFIVAGWSTTED